MIEPEQDYGVMVQRAQDITNVPEFLRCETCGMLPVQVALVWLTTDESSRLCAGCFIGAAMAVAEAMEHNDNTE